MTLRCRVCGATTGVFIDDVCLECDPPSTPPDPDEEDE